MSKRRIIFAYDSWIIKLYCFIRFLIVRVNILEKIEPLFGAYASGEVLDVGCGFGLFSFYNASRHPQLRFRAFDLNSRRIAVAKRAQARLGISNVDFSVSDARLPRDTDRRYKAIYMLDILHHIPVISKYRLLRACERMLDDDGILIIKDVDTRPFPKLAFTWALDKLMGPFNPLSYQGHKKLDHILSTCGFSYSKVFIHDPLPYPHIMLVCRKMGAQPSTPAQAPV